MDDEALSDWLADRVIERAKVKRSVLLEVLQNADKAPQPGDFTREELADFLDMSLATLRRIEQRSFAKARHRYPELERELPTTD
ncbi:MAG: hypothetical protein AAGB14_04510 [Verrucomicrobiota bacterium]